MRRSIFALTAVLVIVFLIQPLAEVAIANPLSPYFKNQPVWGISSPVNRNSLHSSYSNPIVYTKPSFNISFFIELPKNFTQIDSFSYTMNDASAYPLDYAKKDGTFNYTVYSVSKVIDNLEEGIYNLKVNTLYVNGTTSQFMDAYIKIDLTPTFPTDPIFPLVVALIILVLLTLITILFFSTRYIKKPKRNDI
jgi:hypothetical protein